MSTCPICQGELKPSKTEHYIACKSCNHEVLVSGQEQTIMVNDDLDYHKIIKADSNVKAQLKCLIEIGVGSDFLIDMGSGSGKFLYHSKQNFSQVMGIEISEKSFKFATETLDLRIQSVLPEKIDGQLSAVTFWHSLEHIPAENFKEIFQSIYTLSSYDSKVVISVPNAKSLQYSLFKKGYAYYDVPNHLHQFSSKSLDLLMEDFGFEFISSHKMPVYNLFGYMQGWLNNFIAPQNFLYYSLKRNYKYNEFTRLRKTKLVFSILLSGIFLPLSFLFTIYDQLNSNRAGVITRCYAKKKQKNSREFRFVT
jgi:DNA-directed RNA polymerase subunit RPC12/RpoP